MRNLLVVLLLLLGSIASAPAQVTFGIGLPGVSIGINLPVYPRLVPVPGYPVYYAPQMDSNYFFYDGMYWVYQRDNWYASSWYNGPWGLVAPEVVPLYVLRVPVRYYRRPPTYFRGWQADAAPRWGEHWGSSWEGSHGGWDNWNRDAVPAPAPLPTYQRQYSGTRYPHVEQQQALQSQNYRYQPQEAVVQQHYQAPRVQSAPASAPPQDLRGTSRPPASAQSAAPAPRGPPPPTGGVNAPRPATAPPQLAAPMAPHPTPPPPQGSIQRDQQAQRLQGQEPRPATVQARPQQASPAAQQRQASPPPQGTTQRDQQAARPQGQEPKPAAVQARPQQAAPAVQHAASQPPPGTVQREQRAPPAAAHQDQGAEGKKSPQGSKQGQDKGDPQGGERNR